MRLTAHRLNAESSRTVWRVEGALAGEQALLLKQEFSRVPDRQRVYIMVNLENVTYVDEAGGRILAELERQGASLHGANPFVEEVLKRMRPEAKKGKPADMSSAKADVFP